MDWRLGIGKVYGYVCEISSACIVYDILKSGYNLDAYILPSLHRLCR